MDATGWELIVAGCLGILVGAISVGAYWLSQRTLHSVPVTPEPELDDGLVRTLAVLRSAAVVLDSNDRVVRASAPAYSLGLVRDGVVVPAAIRALIEGVRRDGVIRDEELEVPRGPLSSGMLLVQVRVAQVTPEHVVVLAEDQTQARRLEAIRRDFVVNISHELKTPVGALTLLAETVQDAADDPEAVRRFAGRMQTEAVRLSALVHEIIELSRLQVAGALTELAAVDIDDVVKEAVDRARTTADAKHVRLSVGDPSGEKVFGQHDLLVTAVRNLVDNAVAYSGEAAHVGVGVRLVDDIIEVAVVDEGIGISKADQERVFERFYRVDPARSRETGGTGLGLSIVKHVAADHGGDVTVWSQPGRGSTFTMRLPRASLPAVIPPVSPAASSAAPDEGAHVHRNAS